MLLPLGNPIFVKSNLFNLNLFAIACSACFRFTNLMIVGLLARLLVDDKLEDPLY